MRVPTATVYGDGNNRHLGVQEWLVLGYDEEWLQSVMGLDEPPLLVAVLDPDTDPGVAPEGVQIYNDCDTLEGALLGAFRAYSAAALAVFPEFDEDHPEMGRRAREILLEADTRRVINRNTALSRSSDFVEATLANIARRTPDVFGASGALDGGVAFVVSAGPSLSRNVHLLARAREVGPLLVVNTAVPPVAEVTPIDVLVTLENVDVTHHFADHTDVISAAVGAIIGRPETLDFCESRGVPVARACTGGDPAGHAGLAAGMGIVPGGPSVACMATQLAVALGAKTIVLVGQDCAYTGGSTHADATVYDGNRKEGVLTVEAWGGGTVTTDPSLLLFRRWFEAFAGCHGHLDLINATGGGARIRGWAEVSLEAFLHDAPRREVGPNFREIFEGLPPLDESLVEEFLAETRANAKAVKSANAALVAALSTGDGVEEATAGMQALTADEVRYVDAVSNAPMHALLTSDATPAQKRWAGCFVQIRAADQIIALTGTERP